MIFLMNGRMIIIPNTIIASRAMLSHGDIVHNMMAANIAGSISAVTLNNIVSKNSSNRRACDKRFFVIEPVKWL